MRYLTRMVTLNNNLYIFGGFEKQKQMQPNDLIMVTNLYQENKIDMGGMKISDQRYPTEIPGRANHVFSVLNSSEIFICCGNDHSNLLNDIYLQNLVKMKYFEIQINGLKPDKGLSWYNFENNLIVYGGRYGLMLVFSLDNKNNNYKINYDSKYVQRNGAILIENGVLYDFKNTSSKKNRKFEIN